MSTPRRRKLIVPINLGPASNFDRDLFPLSSYRERDKLGKGDLLLDATLDEMLKITAMGTDPSQWEEVIATTKSRYDQLKMQQERLEERSESKTPLQALNLRKAWSDYRAARLFLDAAKTLYMETRSRSEQMRRTITRELFSVVPHEDTQPAGDNIPPDAIVSAVAIPIDDSIDDAQERTILDATSSLVNPFADDPFADPSRSVSDSLLHEWDASSAVGRSAARSDGPSADDAVLQSSSSATQISGPNVYNINIIRNSIISPNSTLRGPTLNQGTGNSGSRS